MKNLNRIYDLYKNYYPIITIKTETLKNYLNSDYVEVLSKYSKTI